jgi:hypothetical protein
MININKMELHVYPMIFPFCHNIPMGDSMCLDVFGTTHRPLALAFHQISGPGFNPKTVSVEQNRIPNPQKAIMHWNHILQVSEVIGATQKKITHIFLWDFHEKKNTPHIPSGKLT